MWLFWLHSIGMNQKWRISSAVPARRRYPGVSCLLTKPYFNEQEEANKTISAHHYKQFFLPFSAILYACVSQGLATTLLLAVSSAFVALWSSHRFFPAVPHLFQNDIHSWAGSLGVQSTEWPCLAFLSHALCLFLWLDVVWYQRQAAPCKGQQLISDLCFFSVKFKPAATLCSTLHLLGQGVSLSTPGGLKHGKTCCSC